MYKLEYLNLRGVAEQIRILFALAKVEFEDVRYSVHFTQNGPVFDPLFEAGKAEGNFDISMSKIPLLTYTDEEGVFILGQSKAIERFVAKKLGLLGSNEIEAVLIDMITEHVRDIKQKFMDVRFGKFGEELAEVKEKFLKEDLPIWFEKLEKCLSGTNGHEIGSKISLADVAIHHIVKDYFEDTHLSNNAAENCPLLTESAQNVHREVREWLDSRPNTMY